VTPPDREAAAASPLLDHNHGLNIIVMSSAAAKRKKQKAREQSAASASQAWPSAAATRPFSTRHDDEESEDEYDAIFDTESAARHRPRTAPSSSSAFPHGGGGLDDFSRMMAAMMMGSMGLGGLGGMNSGDSSSSSSVHSPRDLLLRTHAASVAHMDRMMRNEPHCTVVLTSLSGGSLKPRSNTRVSLDPLLPIYADQLELETTHRGRVLRGRLIVDAVTQAGIGTLIEDDRGNLCRLAVYGYPSVEAEHTLLFKNVAGRRMLPKDTYLAILEPYYKVRAVIAVEDTNIREFDFTIRRKVDLTSSRGCLRVCLCAQRQMDGFTAIRVDDPTDIVILPSPTSPPSTGTADAPSTASVVQAQSTSEKKDAVTTNWQPLKGEGNALVRAGKWNEAWATFTRALQMDGNLLLALLNNLALCKLDLKSHDEALRYALTAIAIDPKLSKSWHRGALALESLNEPAAAKWFAEESIRLNTDAGTVALSRQIVQRIHSAHSSSTLGTKVKSGEAGRLTAIMYAVARSHSGTEDTKEVAKRKAANKIVDPSAEKERGNELYKRGEKAEAATAWMTALHFLTPMSALFSNRALCDLKLPSRTVDALLDTVATLTLDPTQVKAYHRQAEALLALGNFGAADAVCKFGLRLFDDSGMRESFEDLRRRIVVAAPTSRAPPPGASSSSTSSSTTHVSLNERELYKLQLAERKKEAGGVSPAEMNDRILKHQRMDPSLPKMIDERIPPFHTEFARAGRWPLGVNQRECQSKIADGFEAARTALGQELRFRYAALFEGVLQESCLSRLGSIDAGTLEWFDEAPVPHVRFAREHQPNQAQMAYGSGFHSFSNAVSMAARITQGTVHVAVGFVDLGLLRTAKLNVDEQLAPGPLRWIGYDMSAPCVAKTLIIVRMLQHRPESAASSTLIDDVLEVWYSTTWRPTALAAFRRALTQLLEEKDADTETAKEVRQPEVLQLLQHWQKAPVVSLAKARAEWIDIRDSPYDAGNFVQSVDRAAFCSYAISGDVLPAQADSVGSVTMFALPTGLEPALHESIFNVTPLMELLQCRAREADIVAAARAYLREGIVQIHEWISTDRIVIEPRFGMVTINSPTVDVIHALQPYTVSWSNVLDYMTPRDFHTVARACSAAEDTIHFAYSMNWPKQTKGVSILDYGIEARNRMLDEFPPAVVKEVAAYPRARGVLLSPPATSTADLVGFVLATQYHRDWLEAFFDPARAVGPCRLIHVSRTLYNVLARQSTDIAMTFS
jgi:tetratricopeptide (TPR) repeat protein